jgi:DNA-binding transcriptional regulator YdaS (Cro superfamily)
MGVSHTTVMRWADGTIKPNTDTLARLYEATGGKVTPNDMALPQQAAA